MLSIWELLKLPRADVPWAVNQGDEGSFPEQIQPPKAPLDYVLFPCRQAFKVWLGKGTQNVWSIIDVVG